MSKNISKIENNVQDRNSEAWIKLCEYVDYIAEKGADEFSPREYLGDALFAQIFTLPESIGKLKKVKKIWLYGSRLKRIPPEIGQMESLEYFDPYTSDNLRWFPYELAKNINLKDSRISTRMLYGNYKNRMPFPDLTENPVRYEGEHVKCSVCEKKMSYNETNQLWITLWVGTDAVPLLSNVCSKKCKDSLPQPAKGYVQFPHKGGADLKQPSYEDWKAAYVRKMTKEEYDQLIREITKEDPKILKLIKKIWEK